MKRSFPAAECLIIAAGFFLLLFRLGQLPLSNDEAAYAWRVGFDWSHMRDVLSRDNYPYGYFVFLKSWVGFLGIGEIALRLSSVPFSVLTWIAFVPLARMILGRRWGTVALAVLVFSPFLLFLGRIAKYYSAIDFCAVVYTAALCALLSSPNRKRTLQVVLCASALGMMYIHYLGVVYAGVSGVWLLYRRIYRRDQRAGAAIAPLIVAAVAYLPQVYILLHRLAGDTGASPVVIGASLPVRLAVQFGFTALMFASGTTLEASHLVLAAIGIAIFWGAAAWGAWRHVRRDRAQPTPVGQLLLVHTVGAAAGGFAIMWVFLPNLPDMVFGERLSFLYPSIVILAVAGIAAMPRPARITGLLLYLLPTCYSIFQLYAGGENNQWEYLIPWREFQAIDAAAARPRVLIIDDFSFGSRGWYYFARHDPDRVMGIRKAFDAGTPEDLARAATLTPDTDVWLLRTTRDSSPDEFTSRLETNLAATLGKPCEDRFFVFDSRSMARLKALVRGSSAEESRAGKVRFVHFCGSVAPGESTPSH